MGIPEQCINVKWARNWTIVRRNEAFQAKQWVFRPEGGAQLGRFQNEKSIFGLRIGQCFIRTHNGAICAHFDVRVCQQVVCYLGYMQSYTFCRITPYKYIYGMAMRGSLHCCTFVLVCAPPFGPSPRKNANDVANDGGAARRRATERRTILQIVHLTRRERGDIILRCVIEYNTYTHTHHKYPYLFLCIYSIYVLHACKDISYVSYTSIISFQQAHCIPNNVYSIYSE